MTWGKDGIAPGGQKVVGHELLCVRHGRMVGHGAGRPRRGTMCHARFYREAENVNRPDRLVANWLHVEFRDKTRGCAD